MMKKNLFQIGGFALLMCLLTFVGTLSAQQEQVQELPVFATDGSSWTVPTTLNGQPILVTSVKFEAWGGGGAGSFVYLTSGNNNARRAGGGGGGGAYATVTVDNPTGTYNFTIGQGGTGVRNNVTHGGATTITQDGTTILNAVGGRTAATTSNGYTATGAQGGQASACSGITGFTAVNGDNGGNGGNSNTSGAGGHAGGTVNPGTGAGGAQLVRNNSTGATAGNDGSVYGGGGSGAAGYRGIFNTYSANGGAGAAGAVYVTYTYVYRNIEVTDQTLEQCATTSEMGFTKTFTNAVTFTNVTPAQCTLNVVAPATLNLNSYYFDNNALVLSGNVTGITTTTKYDTIKVTITTQDIEKVLKVAIITYAPLSAGSITATTVNCSGTDLWKINNSVSATGGKAPVYHWRYQNNANNSYSYSNSNTEDFTPLIGNYTYWRYVSDEFCNVTKNTSSVTVQKVNPNFDAGKLYVAGVQNTNRTDTICPNDSRTIQLSSKAENRTAGIQYTYQWQRRRGTIYSWGISWTQWSQVSIDYNLNSNNNSTYNVVYNSLTYNNNYDYVYEYRYNVRADNGDTYSECDYLTCEGTYRVVIRHPADYQSQFTDNPKTITLWYGEPDTNLLNMAAPTLTSPTPNTIEKPYIDPDATEHVGRLTPGTYTFYWRVFDACDYARIYSQSVTVVYPKCGEDFQVDYNNYKTYRYGSECWMIENLRTDNADGTFYEDNAAEYGKFGRLYSWNAAVGADNTTTKAVAPSGKTYVQGACPDGWAIPTKAQFNELLGAYSMDQLKSDDQTTWLQGMQGNNESHFGIVGAGYYDATAGKYMKLLGYAGFWTADEKVGLDSQAETIGVVYGCDDNQTPSTNKENKLSIRCVRVK